MSNKNKAVDAGFTLKNYILSQNSQLLVFTMRGKSYFYDYTNNTVLSFSRRFTMLQIDLFGIVTPETMRILVEKSIRQRTGLETTYIAGPVLKRVVSNSQVELARTIEDAFPESIVTCSNILISKIYILNSLGIKDFVLGKSCGIPKEVVDLAEGSLIDESDSNILSTIIGCKILKEIG